MRPLLLSALAFLIVCTAGCDKLAQQTSAVAAAAPSGDVPLAMLPRTIAPMHYSLALTIDPARDRFSGHTEIQVNVLTPQAHYFIHGLDLHVTRVVARLRAGEIISARYEQVHESGVATLTFEKPLPEDMATLIFDYDAPFNASLAGLYKVVDRGDAYAFTQFENTDARRAFPSFDEPGFKTPFDVTVTAPSGEKVIANTPVMQSTAQSGGMTRWVFETTKPLPTYLIALAVGPLDIVDAGDIPPNRVRNRPLALRGVAAKGEGARMKYALSLTPAVIDALENYYGVPYPFPKLDMLAVPDFSAGAMENAGAVTFREQLLLMDKNAPLEQKRQSLSVQAHELAHQWFGDLVTPRWWDDIWLNESFATWMENKIAQQVRPDQDFAEETLKSSLGVMRLDELPSARQIHNPVNTPDDIDNAFDDITYSKGAAVLSMFESFIGPEDFRRGIHLYLMQHAYTNATARDFIGTIAQSTGHPEIVQAFNDFIDQPHVPLMHVDVCCGKRPAVQLGQSTYRPVGIPLPDQHWHVPVCLQWEASGYSCALSGPGPSKMRIEGKRPALIFPNANGAGYYRFALAGKDWRMLIDGAERLSPADRLTLFHNVNAGLRAGQLDAAEFYVLIAKLAPKAEWNLLESDHRDSFNLTDALHDLRVTGVLTPAGIAAQQAFVRQHFGPRLAELGLTPKSGESAFDTLTRAQLVQLLVEEGRDPAVIAPLAKAARAYLESAGKESSVPPELRQEAMRAGIIAEGASFGDLLIRAIQNSSDEYFIQSAIYALAGSEEETTLKKLLALALTPTIRTGDLRYVQRYFAREPLARQVYWAWFKANFDALEQRLSRYGMSGAPAIQKFGCDAASKADLQAFFAPKAHDLEGLPRVLQQSEEGIQRCMAFKAAKGAQINAALAALH
ncbi:MAG TPA: M1 family metallopeptidase [Rhizomicrobium sp.]|nr:M1 family metallopeptidase [Rhizomicrobium sp.]